MGDWRARIQFPIDRSPKCDRDEADIFLSGLASAFLYLHLAATSLGLASLVAQRRGPGPVREAVREILGLPDYIRPYDMMAVGYPSEPPSAAPGSARHRSLRRVWPRGSPDRREHSRPTPVGSPIGACEPIESKDRRRSRRSAIEVRVVFLEVMDASADVDHTQVH